METIVIIDDEAELCRSLEKILTRASYRVVWTTSAVSAIDVINKEVPSCVLLDLKLKDGDGLTVLSQIKKYDKNLPVIMMTAYETVKTAVEAMKQGAFHYMAKPFDVDELKILVAKAIEERGLRRQISDLKLQLGEIADLEDFMGSSVQIREVIKLIRSVAATDVNVLLLGESGTGKELVARTIHHLSKRSAGAFIPVDCAAIPETLIESELFGHEKGSFTGATGTQKGKFELADGGTLFLDEVGNIPVTIQPKLLRCIESREIHRIGGRKPIRTAIRVIAATNADLKSSSHSTEAGFRLDLFYRLNEFPIHLPPLRERREDIPFLCQKFLEQLGSEVGRDIKEISQEALDRLSSYDFPGNVRELRNILKRAIVMAHGEIKLEDLPTVIRNPEQEGPTTREVQVPISGNLPLLEVSRQTTQHVEKQLILDALRKTQGHQGKAAKLLGITSRTLYNKIREYELKNYSSA